LLRARPTTHRLSVPVPGAAAVGRTERKRPWGSSRVRACIEQRSTVFLSPPLSLRAGGVPGLRSPCNAFVVAAYREGGSTGLVRLSPSRPTLSGRSNIPCDPTLPLGTRYRCSASEHGVRRPLGCCTRTEPGLFSPSQTFGDLVAITKLPHRALVPLRHRPRQTKRRPANRSKPPRHPSSVLPDTAVQQPAG
jgi:hypothetical protein